MKNATAPIDSLGRRINYLRLSVTDRCNLRCAYCMPAEGVPKRTHGDILRYEDLLRVSEAALTLGMEKIRVTGGEPLVRKGIVRFLERLSGLPGLKRLVLTTNGILLKDMAGGLKDAGVESLNISLDSLRPDTYSRITRGGDLRRVLEGIEAVERVGFPFVKINVVVLRGVNDDEAADFAALTLDRPYRVRFIEHMPTLPGDSRRNLTVPGEELLRKLSGRFRLLPVSREDLNGPASYYRIEGAVGMLGVITPVSCHFCGECNRIRVSSTGIARSCLFSGAGVDLKPFLEGGDDAALRCALRGVIEAKPERHFLCGDPEEKAPLPMSQVGG
ncbi:MAG: molybdenum cofactor biosynthesis protein [Deltaproteobacteria bacterium]|nr:molybdenum cofactor biosynthesis protein [Deltaproteobacteria bacterium]